MCRIRRFLAVLRSFFHSSLLCTFSCHPSPPTILPSSLTPSCHLFFGLPLNLVVPKFIYNTLLGILFTSILCTCPNQRKLKQCIVTQISSCFSLCALSVSQVMPEVKAVPFNAKQTQFGVRGTALPLLNSDTKRDWVVSTMSQLPYTQERDPVLLVWEAGWASGVGLDGYRIFRPCRNSSLGPCST